MYRLILNPYLIFGFSIFAQCLAAYIGYRLKGKLKDVGGDLDTINTAALTLLGLVIAFTLSMAVSRYDQRKTYEEGEANAIGTEFLRADLLPSRDAQNVKALLTDYARKRIAFYTTRDLRLLNQIDSDNSVLQAKLWSAVLRSVQAKDTPSMAVVVTGMNDVLNAQGYTLSAWLNRIPLSTWILMGLIAIVCNLLLGFRFKGDRAIILLILPTIASVSFLLIADVDSPRSGVIRVLPVNLSLQLEAMTPH